MRTRRSIRIASLCAASAAAVALALPATPATASTRASSALATHSYIVLLRTPSRTIATRASRDAVLSSQDAVASFLGSLGTRATARTLVPDTMTVRLTGAELAGVRHLPGVLGVFANAVIPLPKLPTTPSSAAASRSSKLSLDPGGSEVCGTAKNPQLDPEALLNINAEQAVRSGADGAGVKVAF
ncbi:MAG TPA: hypothetical protein VKT18_05470, partial [Acidimicrobiales bacterium]|nr:hypothetical protein [Acidimicrobiales bacterium]